MADETDQPPDIPQPQDPLRTVALFADLDHDDLASLRKDCSELRLSEGELLFSEGDDGDAAYVLADGEVEVFKFVAGREVLLAAGGGNRLIGEMALLLDEPRNASVRARSAATLIRVSREQFYDILTSSPTAAVAMLDVMTSRLRSTESKLKQSDRMVQLGTLTAGLAHELNNPAAAVERGASRLRDAITAGSRARVAAVNAGIDLTDETMTRLLDRAALSGIEPELTAISRLDHESAVETWLDGQGIEDGWSLAPGLVSMGLDPDSLDEIAGRYEADTTAALTRLLATEHEVAGLLKQIGEGASRMSAIVKALKSYSYLDQAPQQEVMVTEGLEDTLLILDHKLRNIAVDRDYDDALVPVMAFGSELNQVWTNLIDNAAYAIEDAETENGKITIRAFSEDDTVVVEVEDNGPGIPDDIQIRIFDSFFTTKPVGSGTGLGLDISYGIVVDRHRGQISVTSKPGMTCFRVALPIRTP